MPTSGAFTSWLCDVTSSDFATLTDEARTSPPGACGLVVLPHLEGVRTPVFDPDARGVIAGLTLSHTRGDLYRAALEGIAYGVRHNLESMADAAGPRPLRLVAVGGGTRGDLWTQIVSDVTGLAQRIPAETIGACYGDALLAAAATGRAHAPEDWSSSGVTVTPNEAVRDRYSARYEQYMGLFDSTRGLMHELAAEQRSVGTIDVAAPR
jgi:xylulokinase